MSTKQSTPTTTHFLSPRRFLSNDFTYSSIPHPSPHHAITLNALRTELTAMSRIQMRRNVNDQLIDIHLKKMAVGAPRGRKLPCCEVDHVHGGYKFVNGSSQHRTMKIGYWLQQCRVKYTKVFCHQREATSPLDPEHILSDPTLYAALVMREELKPKPRVPPTLPHSNPMPPRDASAPFVPPPFSSIYAPSPSRNLFVTPPQRRIRQPAMPYFTRSPQRGASPLSEDSIFHTPSNSRIRQLVTSDLRRVIDLTRGSPTRQLATGSGSSSGHPSHTIDLTKDSSTGYPVLDLSGDGTKKIIDLCDSGSDADDESSESGTPVGKLVNARFYVDTGRDFVKVRLLARDNGYLRLADHRATLNSLGVGIRRYFWRLLGSDDETPDIWIRSFWVDMIPVANLGEDDIIIFKQDNVVTPFDAE